MINTMGSQDEQKTFVSQKPQKISMCVPKD